MFVTYLLKTFCVTSSFDSNIWINSSHASFDVNFDFTCEITLLSKQLLMVESTRSLCSTQSLMPPAPVAGKARVLTVI
jgi:hypothetical protein